MVGNGIGARYWGLQLTQALAAEGAAPAIVGLDVEWKPTFVARRGERKAAVLQLSGPGICLVIQLFKLSKTAFLGSPLREILEDPATLKVCVCEKGQTERARSVSNV